MALLTTAQTANVAIAAYSYNEGLRVDTSLMGYYFLPLRRWPDRDFLVRRMDC